MSARRIVALAAALGAVVSGGCTLPEYRFNVLPVPRLIGPLSTSILSFGQPTFRWTPVEGIDEVQIDVCLDPMCMTPERPPFFASATDGQYRPMDTLSVGVKFWRVRGRSRGIPALDASPIWQFTVTNPERPTGSVWGTSADFNRDGFADVIVGAPFQNTSAGTAQVYSGGAGGRATAPSWTTSGVAGSFHGWRVASAGDVNGDGFGDAIVTAVGAERTGAVRIYHGSATGLSPQPATTIEGGPDERFAFGSAAIGAGDVNGDGYGDIAVSAVSVTTPPTLRPVRVYLGGAAGIESGSVVVLQPAGARPQFGAALASAGDLNGDGFADIVVGECNVERGVDQPDDPCPGSRVYTFMGSSTGTMMEATLSRPPDTVAWGGSIGEPGDFDANGYADLVIGSMRLIPNPLPLAGQFRGQFTVFELQSTGLINRMDGITTTLQDVRTMVNVTGAGNLNTDVGAEIAVAITPDPGRGPAMGPQENEIRVFSRVIPSTPRSETRFEPTGASYRNVAEDLTLGAPIRPTGDTNGDGRTELIVGDRAEFNFANGMIVRSADVALIFGPLPAMGPWTPERLGGTMETGFGFGVALRAPAGPPTRFVGDLLAPARRASRL